LALAFESGKSRPVQNQKQDQSQNIKDPEFAPGRTEYGNKANPLAQKHNQQSNQKIHLLSEIAEE